MDYGWFWLPWNVQIPMDNKLVATRINELIRVLVLNSNLTSIELATASD